MSEQPIPAPIDGVEQRLDVLIGLQRHLLAELRAGRQPRPEPPAGTVELREPARPRKRG